MPNPVHPPLDQIKVTYQSPHFTEEKIHSRVVRYDNRGLFKVFDLGPKPVKTMSSGYTIREYLIPSTVLPLEVAALAAMRAGIQMAATEWPLVPMEDFQLA